MDQPDLSLMIRTRELYVDKALDYYLRRDPLGAKRTLNKLFL